MTNLFEGVTGQRTDNNGKCRMLNYGDGLSLMVSPLPPLNVPEDRIIKKASLSKVISFIQDRGLEISYKDVHRDAQDTTTIEGLWVQEKIQGQGAIYYGYIPVKSITATSAKGLETVQESDRNNPLQTDDHSDLSIFRGNRKTAEVLKQYVLFAYANNPEYFGDGSFLVDESHVYDIDKLNKRLFIDDNDIIFRDGLFIVTSDEMQKALLSYLKVKLLNNKASVLNMVHQRKMENYYQTLSDFRNTDNQLIFIGKNGLLRWKEDIERSKTRGRISNSIFHSVEPYFYKNVNIRGDGLMIVQNVTGGDLEKALGVAQYWMNNKVNLGYYGSKTEINRKDISYKIYETSGLAEDKSNKKTSTLSIMRFTRDGEAAVIYAALLFI